MQVILREDIEKVGLRGEVVDVAPGFARNYLLPRRLAEPAAPGRVVELEKLAASRARHEAQSFDEAQELVQKLEGAEIRFDVNAGETGTLFGSVTATDIADRVWDTQRIRLDRRKLDLPESIKRIGRYQVPVELFPDVTATLRLAIVPEGGELPPEEELEALAAAEAEAEAEAQAQAEAEHEQAEAAIEEVVAEDEEEADEEIQAEAASDASEPEPETAEPETAEPDEHETAEPGA
jgi:large subunit ribosomal protein L9